MSTRRSIVSCSTARVAPAPPRAPAVRGASPVSRSGAANDRRSSTIISTSQVLASHLIMNHVSASLSELGVASTYPRLPDCGKRISTARPKR